MLVTVRFFKVLQIRNVHIIINFRWDLRTGKCVQKFHDAFGASLYCLDYDYCNSVIVGTCLHSRAAIWDIRSEHCVQVRIFNIRVNCCLAMSNSSYYL